MAKKKGKKKGNKKRINAWKPRPHKFNVLALLGWCAVLIALCGAAILLFHSGAAGTQAADVVISEVMTANAAAWPTESGAFYDWLELWNRSDHSVQLGGYRLSDALDVRGAYILPDLELAPDERIVLYCADQAAEEDLLCVDFTLGKDGASLVLLDPTGTASAFAVDVPSLRKNESYALQEDGSWQATAAFTPGLENTQEAHDGLSVRVAETGPLYINELMASNSETIRDMDGDYSDWIEIRNDSAAPVNLNGWALAEGKGSLRKWSFPERTLGAGEYLLVFASGKDRAGEELHANFKLSAGGETIYLLNEDGRIASMAAYSRLEPDVSLSRTEGGSFTTTLAPSPGRENGTVETGGTGIAMQPLTQNSEGLYINEVMCAMTNGSDWVELYNGGAAAVDLSGWWLSDRESHPRKWSFPEGTQIAQGGYLVVLLDGPGEVNAAQSSYLCADFSLNLEGEMLLLSRPDGSVLDSVVLNNQRKNISYGRAAGSDNYRFFAEMTPGAANAATSYAACLSEVEFSVEGGWIDGPVTVELRSPEGAAIYYTTDGSAPKNSSNRYEGPITIADNTPLRATAWVEDTIPSESVCNTYIIDDQSKLRLVCVNGDPSLSTRSGVLRTGSKKKQEVSVEVYDYDGSKMLVQNCELMMVGSQTRVKADYPQKAFRLKAKSAYGDSKFRAPLFRDRDYEEYETFVMRASGQDSRKAFMRDALLTSLAADTSVFYQEAELSVCYVNGKYWGVYYMREHVDADSVCQFEGWDPDDADISILESGSYHAVVGSSDSFAEMVSFVRQHDLSKDENIEILRTMCDIENYLDYVILEIYVEQEDLSNVRVYRNANGDGLWRWVLYDLDLSYMNDKNSVGMWINSKGRIGSITTQSNELFYELMKNAKMRDYFLTRFGELLATTLSSENVIAKIQACYDALEVDMKKTTARWEWKYSFWQKQVGQVASYAQKRPARLLEFIQRSFELSNEQMWHYFGDAAEKIQAN